MQFNDSQVEARCKAIVSSLWQWIFRVTETVTEYMTRYLNSYIKSKKIFFFTFSQLLSL